MTRFVSELAKRRAGLGLSQAAMAKAVGCITTSYVSAIEHGRNVPTIELVDRWSKVLGISMDEFLAMFRKDRSAKELHGSDKASSQPAA